MKVIREVEATIFAKPRSVQTGFRFGKYGRYNNTDKKLYASEIIKESSHLKPDKPIDGGCIFAAVFHLEHDGSKSGDAWDSPTDLDNLEKGTIDGLAKAGFVANDKLIYAKQTKKIWADEFGPRIEFKFIQTYEPRANTPPEKKVSSRIRGVQKTGGAKGGRGRKRGS